MPTYTCTSVEGLLSETKKHALAMVITAAHAEITGAPSYFAQVQFFDLPKGNIFIGGKKLNHDHLFIFGHRRVSEPQSYLSGNFTDSPKYEISSWERAYIAQIIKRLWQLV